MSVYKAEMPMDFGPVRRWRDGDVLYAENDWILMAYAVTDDSEKVGELGWCGEGQNAICVEWIAKEQAKPWDH